jgi:hypothetical protein
MAETAAEEKRKNDEQRAWEQSKAGRLCSTHTEWDKWECENIADRKIWIGMSYEMLVAAYGSKPSSANPSNYGGTTQWQWCWWNLTPSCFYDNDGDKLIDSYN